MGAPKCVNNALKKHNTTTPETDKNSIIQINIFNVVISFSMTLWMNRFNDNINKKTEVQIIHKKSIICTSCVLFIFIDIPYLLFIILYGLC